MWYGLRNTSKFNPDLAVSTAELLQPTLRNLIYATGILCTIGYFAAYPSALHNDVTGISFALIVVALASVLAHRLLTHHLLAAEVIWLSGITLAILLSMHTFQRPELSALFMLVPLISSVTLGWPGGLVAEAVVLIILLWLLPQPVSLPVWQGLAPVILLGGAISTVLGWTATDALLTISQWSLYHFELARREMEDSREQRMELIQVQEDLLLSNSELARLSDRLRAMQNITEDAKRAKEQFVANVSHELRTPLNMIIGFSEMILQLPQVYGANLPQTLLADIAAIQRNSQHLAKLVDDVLDLSQIDAGQMTISREWVNVQEIIEDACQAVRVLFDSKGLYLKTEIQDDLPAVLCDRTRIRQVTINLLSNAGRFTERGGVVVTAEVKDNLLTVSVADTGPGIAPADQQRLFKPFQQVDTSIRRSHGGSGLGLAISRQFIEMHGGSIWLERAVEKGTTIMFSLPVEPTVPTIIEYGNQAQRWFHPYDAHNYNVRTRRTKAPTPEPAPRFMLVEQRNALRRLFDRYLPDVETLAMSTVDEAIEQLQHAPVQSVIINTPPIQGVTEANDRSANLPFGTPVITCWIPSGDEALRKLSVIDYLVKPIAREKLLAKLTTCGEQVKTVLLVDDDPETLRLFSRMIASAEQEYRILQASDGSRALDLMRTRHPDIVLLDLIMPQMGGMQVLLEKQEDPAIQPIPVIVLSSMDPRGQFDIGTTLTVKRGALSPHNLIMVMQKISEILSPSDGAHSSAAGQVSPEKPGA